LMHYKFRHTEQMGSLQIPVVIPKVGWALQSRY
jgi:hypothetical protein